MPSPSDLLEASALEQARLVRERQVSCRELAELYLARIERLDPALSAFVEVTADAALAQARRYDRLGRSAPRPLFFGVPVGVKDLNLLRGTRTRFGTRALPPLIAPVDDASVALLRRAGFVFLGKTSTSELGAMPVTEPDIHPPTRNPWNLGRSAGGSSGGSAAAVAAGLLPIAQASDGAGSVRIPASFNHLYGFKPSRGRVPEPFHRDDRSVLYTMGPLARSVDDAAAMLDVLSGLAVGTPHWAPPPPQAFAERARRRPPRLRVRFTVQTPLTDVDPDARAAVLRVAGLLESMGHRVEEGTMVAGSVDDFLGLWPSIVRLFPIADWSLVQPVTRWLAGLGRDVTPDRVRALHADLERRVLDWFEGSDVWLTPSVPVPPPEVGAWASLEPSEAFTRASTLGPFTAPFNASGQPAASIPAGFGATGLPLGVQLVGKPFADALLLALSRQLEEAMPWAGLHPPIWSELAISRRKSGPTSSARRPEPRRFSQGHVPFGPPPACLIWLYQALSGLIKPSQAFSGLVAPTPPHERQARREGAQPGAARALRADGRAATTVVVITPAAGVGDAAGLAARAGRARAARAALAACAAGAAATARATRTARTAFAR